MSFSLDLSLLATLFGFVMVILTGLVYWGKVNFLIFAQKQIIIELASTNKELLVKAERYSHGTRLSGPKIRISRLMSSFSRQYVVPSSVMVVSGLAAVAWLFCLFLMVASYIYTGVQHISIINIILLVTQTNVGAMLLMGWFGRNNSVEKPMLFLMSSLVWWAVFTAAGILMGVFGLFFHVIPLDQIHYAFYSFSLMPIFPILWAVCVALAYLWSERKKYKNLRKAVFAFEEFRKEKSQRIKKK